MIGEDGDKLFLVLGLEEVLHRSGWELREGLVCGREDGEGSAAFKSVGEVGCAQSRGERLKLARLNRRVDNVLLGGARVDAGQRQADGRDRRGRDICKLKLHVFCSLFSLDVHTLWGCCYFHMVIFSLTASHIFVRILDFLLEKIISHWFDPGKTGLAMLSDTFVAGLAHYAIGPKISALRQKKKLGRFS